MNSLPKIDSKAIDEFTRGQCHALALALHERTGLPLAGIWCDYHDLPETPCHVVVMLEDGKLLDIEGPNAEERWDGKVYPLAKVEVEDFCNRDYVKPRMKTAMLYAEAVLKQNAAELKRLGIKPFKTRKRRTP